MLYECDNVTMLYEFVFVLHIPYRLGFSPQTKKNILVSHSRINPAPWKYIISHQPRTGIYA